MQTIKKNRKQPELRFKEFDNSLNINSYERYSFEDIFSFSTGKNIKQNEASPKFKTPCVRYGELYHMYQEVIYSIFNKTDLPESELLFSKGDEILLPSAGEEPIGIGAASALPFKNVAIGRTINILRPKKKETYSQFYVSYYINEKLKKDIARLAKGVSISNVYNSDLKKLSITLPNLDEQKKVAEFLSSVDKKIQQLTKKKELLEDYKKGIMQKIFSQEIRFKDDYGDNYPNWKKRKLNEVGEIICGKTPRTNDKSLWGGHIQFITPTDITDCDKYQNNVKRFVTENSKIKVLPINTIVYTCVASIGKISITSKPAITNQQINAIVTSDDYYYQLIYYVLVYITPRIKSMKSTTTLPIINKTEFSNIIINIPEDIDEQKKIGEFLSSIDKKIDCVSVQIDKTREFKKGLLQQMFV